MAISTGSFTIIDMNDATSLTSYIACNHAKYQLYNPDNGSYNPNWKTSNLVLTPELYVTSTTSNIITSTDVQSVEWFKDNSTTKISTGTNYALSGTNGYILTVKDNILASASQVLFTCVIKYKDPTTGLILTVKDDVSFIKVASGGGITDALASTPNGNAFKNSTITSLTADCYLWRGSIRDETDVTYQWYAMDSSVTTDQGGGTGWKKLSNTTNKYTGVTTAIMTVYPSAVDSVQAFKCVITDTSVGANNTKYTDTVSFLDLSDPIQCEVQSTGGNIFQNGIGSSVLTARLFQAGTEIDLDGTKYTYKWYKYDKDSSLVSNFGGTGVAYKTGKTLNVGSSDVNLKATFRVEIE